MMKYSFISNKEFQNTVGDQIRVTEFVIGHSLDIGGGMVM